jgi:hypothetical protein
MFSPSPPPPNRAGPHATHEPYVVQVWPLHYAHCPTADPHLFRVVSWTKYEYFVIKNDAEIVFLARKLNYLQR